MGEAVRTGPAYQGTYRLGSSVVARTGFGAMQLQRLSGEPDRAVAILQRAVELGVNHIDTAEFYGCGFVNKVIRQVIGQRDGILIASKIGGDHDKIGNRPIVPAQRPEQLRASVEDNLRSLGLEQIELVNLRRADGAHGLKVPPDQIVDIDDQMAAMIDLRNEGKIGSIGLSAVDMAQLTRCMAAGIACVQNDYSLVNRASEDMLELCTANQIAWVPFFPLGGGRPDMPQVADQPAVLAVAARLQVTPSQAGLAWILHRAPSTLLIPGTTSRKHLEENMAVSAIELDAEALADLDGIEVRAHAL